MKKLAFTLLLLLGVHQASAQYPFEKYPSPRVKEFSEWRLFQADTISDLPDSALIDLKDVFPGGESCAISLSNVVPSPDWLTRIRIYHSGKLIQEFRSDSLFFERFYFTSGSVQVGDINGDRLPDIKFSGCYMGSGLAAFGYRTIYLFQRPGGRFTKISFDNMKVWKERDFDSDESYEIIVMDLNGIRGHSYWAFNLFRYRNGVLESVSERFGYPLFIQYLFRENYRPARSITRQERIAHRLSSPPEYTIDHGDSF